MKCKDCTFYYCQYRTTDAEKDCYYEQWTTKKPFDLQSFRAEAAKDILCALIHKTDNFIGKDSAGYAIMIADELIKQLKEKEEK